MNFSFFRGTFKIIKSFAELECPQELRHFHYTLENFNFKIHETNNTFGWQKTWRIDKKCKDLKFTSTKNLSLFL